MSDKLTLIGEQAIRDLIAKVASLEARLAAAEAVCRALDGPHHNGIWLPISDNERFWMQTLLMTWSELVPKQGEERK